MTTPTIGAKWWEKTVEYLFVRTILPQDALATPLAGSVEEFLGDLLEGNHEAFRLIEFKRDHTVINSELTKYLSPDEGKQVRDEYFADYLSRRSPQLFEQPGAKGHWLVYGVLQPGSNELRLIGRQYGTRALPEVVIEDDGDLGRVSAASLWSYLEKLMMLRKRVGVHGSSGGLVVACHKDNVLVQSPIEFLQAVLQLAPKMAQVAKRQWAVDPPAPDRDYDIPRGR